MEYIYSLENKQTISFKKRLVFCIKVCNNKLFDCHHSDKDRIYFIHEYQKWMQLVKQKDLLVKK